MQFYDILMKFQVGRLSCSGDTNYLWKSVFRKNRICLICDLDFQLYLQNGLIDQFQALTYRVKVRSTHLYSINKSVFSSKLSLYFSLTSISIFVFFSMHPFWIQKLFDSHCEFLTQSPFYVSVSKSPNCGISMMLVSSNLWRLARCSVCPLR